MHSKEQQVSSADAHIHDPLDPQIRRFVTALAQAWARHPAAESLPIAEKRRIAEIVRMPWRRGGPAMAAIRDMHLPTRHGEVRARIHRPIESDAARPALIYLHGGGWTMFSLDTHDRIMRELAARAGVVVIGIDYALSPEVKFPHALEQIVDATRAVHAQAAALGLDAQRLAIGGDSAGANLAVAASLVLRDAAGWAVKPSMYRHNGLGLPAQPTKLPRGMLLIYGCYTDAISAAAARGFGAEGNLLSAAEMAAFWRNYLAAPTDALDPLAAPLRAELAGLPPAFLIGAQCDVLAEQSRSFAAKLRAAGVDTDFAEYPGATHSFLEAVSIATVADRALADAAAWLRRLFS
jgi:acetyl esterase